MLNNEFIAAKMHELLQHLENSGEFVTSYLPFYVLGFGNGSNIGSFWATRYGMALSRHATSQTRHWHVSATSLARHWHVTGTSLARH